MALISIYVIIFFFDPSNALTSNAPITGEKTTGVRKETPKRPYFFQKETNLLFRLVNNFLFLLNILSIHFLNPGPNVDMIRMVVIIPIIVIPTVSQNVRPNAIPMAGPPINLNILAKKTDKYLAITDKINITRQHYMYNIYKSIVK